MRNDRKMYVLIAMGRIRSCSEDSKILEHKSAGSRFRIRMKNGKIAGAKK
jgi:hypothetical protein